MNDSDRKSELNRELNSYIASKRKSGFSLKGIFTGNPRSQDTSSLHPEVKTYTAEEKSKEPIPDAEENTEELEQEYAEESEGFLSKLKSLFSSKESKEEEEVVEAIEDPDLKEIARITLTVLKKLPAQDLREFKNSEDFAKFKDILTRNELIK